MYGFVWGELLVIATASLIVTQANQRIEVWCSEWPLLRSIPSTKCTPPPQPERVKKADSQYGTLLLHPQVCSSWSLLRLPTWLLEAQTFPFLHSEFPNSQSVSTCLEPCSCGGLRRANGLTLCNHVVHLLSHLSLRTAAILAVDLRTMRTGFHRWPPPFHPPKIEKSRAGGAS